MDRGAWWVTVHEVIKSWTQLTKQSTMRPDAMTLGFKNSLVLRWLFHSPPSSSLRGSLVPLHLLSLEWYHRISEVVDVPPAYLDFSLQPIQPGISHCID